MLPADYREYTDATVDHMEEFAKEGFRTLVLAYRIISEQDYQVRVFFYIFLQKKFITSFTLWIF
jgi:magnesium-transporting ATPase (P-type)